MCSTSLPKVSPSRLREPADADYSRICARLEEALEAGRGRQGVAQASAPEWAEAIIARRGIQSLLIDDGMLLVFQVGSPWYASYTVVQELLVLRIGEGGTLKDVRDLLDDVAEHVDASAISVSTALCPRDKVLARSYQSAGYEFDNSPRLIKWRK